MSHEQKYLASKFQGLLKEYGQVLELLIVETKREYDAPINEDTVEAIGLRYAKNQSAKEALTLFMKKLNSKANERE